MLVQPIVNLLVVASVQVLVAQAAVDLVLADAQEVAAEVVKEIVLREVLKDICVTDVWGIVPVDAQEAVEADALVPVQENALVAEVDARRGAQMYVQEGVLLLAEDAQEDVLVVLMNALGAAAVEETVVVDALVAQVIVEEPVATDAVL